MAWVSLTADDVKERLSGPEYTAATTWHLSSGQSDPLPDTITGVVREIRGRVAACQRNTLDADATKIPDELYHAAITLIARRVLLRIPGAGVELQDEGRSKEYEEAQQLLRDVANCDLAVEQPSAHSCTPDSNNENQAGRFGGTTLLSF